MKDFRGTVIHDGDYIVYAVRRGSSMHLSGATVTDASMMRPRGFSGLDECIKAKRDDGRVVTLGKSFYIVVLS